MSAIIEHELDYHCRSFSSYLCAAILLLATGIGSLFYNINSAVANFEYVLAAVSLIYALVIPVLTMKSIAEEKKQKTDQLLYSLPLSMSEIVLGKYIALITVLFIPMMFIAIYPYLFSKYGNVYLPTSYGSLIGFYLLGCALIAVGMFISSLTEHQGLAAGISAALIVLNYYLGNLSEYVNISFISTLMTKLSLFERFYAFVNGVFDITAVVYFLSVAAFFIFLTIQTMEKRRYN